jgi:hypothetical protein
MNLWNSRDTAGDKRRKVWVNATTRIQVDCRKRATRKKPSVHDQKVREALRKLWDIMDYICGKMLAPGLRATVMHLERCREIQISDTVREKLFRICPATRNRLPAKERKKQQITGRSNTKPGRLLRNQIPIRTFGLR